MTIITTERVEIRRIEVDDAPFILGLLNEPSFLEFIGDRGVRTIEQARDYILKGPLASYERHGFGLYLVVEIESGAPIGICGLLKRDALPDVDIGFAFVPESCGRGYAFEAASAVMDYGKNTLGLTRIVAVLSPRNVRSRRLLEKLGMGSEGMVRLGVEGEDLLLMSTSACPESPAQSG